MSLILCFTFLHIEKVDAATNIVEDLKYEIFTAENGQKEIRII